MQPVDDRDVEEFLLREQPRGGRSRWWQLPAAVIAATLTFAAWSWADQRSTFTWTRVKVAPQTLESPTATGYLLRDIVCPSAQLCIAPGDSYYFRTHDPTGPGEGWDLLQNPVDGWPFYGLACPSERLCVGVNDRRIVTSTDPSAATPSWTTQVEGSFWNVACGSVTMCVVATYDGDGYVSTDPAGGAETWKSRTIDPVNGPLHTLSCPSAQLCVAGDRHGFLLISTAPADPLVAWASTQLSQGSVDVVDCPSAQFCIAVDSGGAVYTSTEPAKLSSWQQVSTVPTGGLADLDCPTTSRCLGTTRDAILQDDDPSEPASQWASATMPDTRRMIDCLQPTFCVSVDWAGYASIGTSPNLTGTLSIAVDGTGGGTITGAGLSCPPTCTTSLDRGSTVSITAQPDAASAFAGWGSACTGSGATCDVTVAKQTQAIATFARRPTTPGFGLTIIIGGPTGGGTIRGTGISCPDTCRAEYPVGTSLELRASPAAGHAFEGWGGDCSGRASCRLSMNRIRAVRATFGESSGTPTKVKISRASISTKNHRARFTFTTSKKRSMRCSLVRFKGARKPSPKFSGCRSPKIYKHLKAGRYVFSVKTTENRAKPTTRRFKIR